MWDTTRKTIQGIFEGHTDKVIDIAITSNELYFISISSDGTLRTWNITYKILEFLIKLKFSKLATVALTPNSKYAIITTLSSAIYILKTPKKIYN